jgi:methionyl-tRNA synthetase
MIALMKRRILITAALPYANGSIHVGHLVEYLQADFWTRFQKLRGHECHYICADDTHGTAIMVEARKRNISPESLIAEKWKEHTEDFKNFQIEFSHYSSTNSEENRKLCEEFYSHMKNKGHITTKMIDQLYCNHDKMFLPDRFVKGTCPKCGATDQYGDSCDKCGATYAPTDLKAPFCSICGTPPVMKSSEHILFKLNDFKSYLASWLPEHTSKEMANKMQEWFNEDLRPWDISRDEPYFGFKIPGTDSKYFYVWVDAPMGYISSSLQFFKKQFPQNAEQIFNEFWKEHKNTEVYHLIGKDIVYFHTLFWPALLKAAEYRTPNQVFVHGMLTVNGEKMSKSKGTQVYAKTYLKHLDPMYLRYYFASKMSGGVDDLDLNFEDFVSRTNSELVGKITNLASRGAQMLGKKMDGVMSQCDPAGTRLIQHAQKAANEIADFYEHREFAKALSIIRHLADEANRYFDEKAPWKTLSTHPEETKQVLTTTLNLFRILSIYLKPILPKYTEQVEKLFNEKPYHWDSIKIVLENHKINDYEHLAQRIDPDKIMAIIKDSTVTSEPSKQNNNTTSKTQEDRNAASTSEIEFVDFEKVDLRIAKIIEAEEIAEADKLLRLKVDLGPLGQRQIIAGIKSAYKADSLVGRLTVIVANLKPRKMKFGMSEGMVLAAGTGGSSLFILSPDNGAQPGDKVK